MMVKFFSDPFLASRCLILLNHPHKHHPSRSLWRDVAPNPSPRAPRWGWTRWEDACSTCSEDAVSSFEVFFGLILQSKRRAVWVEKSEMWLASMLVTTLGPGEGALLATC